MKKNTGIFVILGVAALAFIYYRKLIGAKNFKFVLRGVTFGGKLLEPKIFIKVGIQNTGSSSIIINSISGDIISDKKIIANVSSFNKVDIRPNSESIIELTAQPALFGAIQTIISSLKNKVKNVKFIFDGSINVEGNNVPVNASYTI